MKTNLLTTFGLLFFFTGLMSQTYDVNGNWIYGPTGTIKTITATQDGLQSIIDGNDKIDKFKKIGTNKYQSYDKSSLFLEFKSRDLHLQYNTASNKQNTWTRHGDLPYKQTTQNRTSGNNQTTVSQGGSSYSSNNKANEIGIKGSRPYNHAIGLRAGYPTQVTYKKFLNETKAFEIYGGINPAWFNFGASYQFHRELSILDEIFPWVEKGQWYFGAGMSGFSYRNLPDFLGDDFNRFAWAPFGILGWSYNITNLPITLGADIQPSFALGGGSNVYGSALTGLGWYGGGYIRYIIN